MKKALAIDIGGTKTSYCIIDKSGKIISDINKIKTEKTVEKILQNLKKIIKDKEDSVDCIAIATAGAVNLQNNKVISSTGNLPKGYSDIDFSKLSNKKVFLENDANAAAWAEYKIGAAKGHSNTIIVTLGTGVGSGIIVNNKLLKGKNGAAGEMHFKIYPDKRRKCTCGSYDCWEAYASGSGLKKTAEEVYNNKEVTTYDVISGLKENNKKAKEAFEKWQNDIIVGCVGLTNIFDPDSIVMSGSMAEFLEYKKIEKIVNSDIVTTPTKIIKAKFDNNAGMIGAALLALEEV